MGVSIVNSNGVVSSDQIIWDTGREYKLNAELNSGEYYYIKVYDYSNVNDADYNFSYSIVNKGFADVPSGQYFTDAVDWAVDKGVTSGTTSTTFSPYDSCTRAQVVTFLWRAYGSPVVSGTSPFTDVQDSSKYYYKAVLWAAQKGITSGKTPTYFGVNDTVTRGQFVTFLYRAKGNPSASSNTGFNDVSSSAYYAKAVSWAAKKGITTGTGNNCFSPNAACTRGQVVTFLYRALK